MAKETFLFDRPGTERVVAGIRKIESLGDQGGEGDIDRSDHRPGPQIRIGVAKTDIKAFAIGFGGNPDTWGTGTMQVKRVTRSDSVDDGEWEDASFTLETHNPGGAIGLGQRMSAYLAGGVWVARPLVESAVQYFNGAAETTLGTTHHPSKFYPLLDTTPAANCGDFFLDTVIDSSPVIKNRFTETMCLELGYGMGMDWSDSAGTDQVEIYCQLEIWNASPSFDSVVRGSVQPLAIPPLWLNNPDTPPPTWVQESASGSCGTGNLLVDLPGGYSVRLACIMESGKSSAEWNAYSIPIDYAMLSGKAVQ